MKKQAVARYSVHSILAPVLNRVQRDCMSLKNVSVRGSNVVIRNTNSQYYQLLHIYVQKLMASSLSVIIYGRSKHSRILPIQKKWILVGSRVFSYAQVSSIFRLHEMSVILYSSLVSKTKKTFESWLRIRCYFHQM